MMSKLLIGGAIAAFAATAAFAQAAPATAPAAKPGAHKHMMRTETRTDVAANVGKMFARLDTNKDGFIDQAEMQAARTTMREHMGKMRGHWRHRPDRPGMPPPGADAPKPDAGQ